MSSKMHIRRGDTVIFLQALTNPRSSGVPDVREGQRGKVIRMLPDKDGVLVEGGKVVIKNRRVPKVGRTAVQQQTGRIEKPAPIPRAKVMLVCPRCDRPTKVRMRETGAGKRVRVCRKCNQDIDEI